MTRLRVGDTLRELDDLEWPYWVRTGRVPPDALVLSPLWTRGVWRRADSLEVYHLFRPPDVSTAVETSAPDPHHGPFKLFRGPGPSLTELLVLLNIVVMTVLLWTWRGSYSDQLWEFSRRLRSALEAGWVPVLTIPLFLHASLPHLFSNLLSLLGAGALVEEFYGRFRLLVFYLFSGLSGAVLSLLREKDVLSVGASGAIQGLYGVALVFLLRERDRFTPRQRWKATRVYLPFLVLIVLPSLFYADFYSHVGGFLGGIAIALVVRPLRSRLPRRPGEGEAVLVEFPDPNARVG